MAETPEVVTAEVAPVAQGTAPAPAAPVSGETPPVATPEETKPPRTFTQEEVNSIVGREKARVERKLRNELRPAEPAKPEPVKPTVKPTPEKYASTEEYIEAVAEWKAGQIFEDRQRQFHEDRTKQANAKAAQDYAQREEVARVAYSDFDDVVYNPQVPITEAMAAAIQHSDRGPDLAYFLGKNPQEAARIAQYSPFLQAKELGRLEAKLPDRPAPAQTEAPAPIPAAKPTGGKPVYDTTDPRSTKHMSATDWINAERDRQRKNWEARNR